LVDIDIFQRNLIPARSQKLSISIMALDSLTNSIAQAVLRELHPTAPLPVDLLRSEDEGKRRSLQPGVVLALSWNHQVLFTQVVRRSNLDKVLQDLLNPLVAHYREIPIEDETVATAVHGLILNLLGSMMPGAGVFGGPRISHGSSAAKVDPDSGLPRRGPGRPRKVPVEPPKPKRAGPGRPRKNEDS
jgi:hypothetical protein